MNDSEEIIILFSRAVHQPSAVFLLNTFHALPISYPLKEIKLEEKTIAIKTEQIQILCLSHQNSTIIKSDLFPKIIQAKIYEVDFLSDEAILGDFSYCEMQTIIKREQVRVEPQEPIIGIFFIEDENSPSLCEIADVSLDGLGIYLQEEEVYSAKKTVIGQPITVHFRLPIDKTYGYQNTIESIPYTPPLQKDYRLFSRLYIPEPLMKYPSIWGKVGIQKEIKSIGCVVEGIIVNKDEETKMNRIRLGIRLVNQKNDIFLRNSRANISKYIVQRQSEIIHEIREKYDLVSWLVMNEKTQ